MVKYSAEKFNDLIPELIPLFASQFEELAPYSDIKLAPDYVKYGQLCLAGILKVFTARIDGKLVGYCFMFISYDIHYSKSVQANQDLIYIDKSHRGFGSHFIDWIDSNLKLMGVQVVTHHCKTFANWGNMLMRKGYQEMDVYYSKRLDLEV